MKFRRVKLHFIAILALILSIFGFEGVSRAKIYDTSTCQVNHSGTGNTCTNATYAYAFEATGEWVNSFVLHYTGYSSSIKITKLELRPSKVTTGRPYYVSAWISGPDTTVSRYYPATDEKFLTVGKNVYFYPNKTVNLEGQATLRIYSNLDGGYASDNYDVITYPR